MTEQEINIAIAEFCGGIWLYNPDAENPHRFLFMPENQIISHMHLFRECKNMDIPIAFDMMQGIPNYYKDLNAVHESEKKLSPEQEEEYVEILSSLMSAATYGQDDQRWERSNLSSSDSTYRATAPQRCDALLRAIGKWKQ